MSTPASKLAGLCKDGETVQRKPRFIIKKVNQIQNEQPQQVDITERVYDYYKENNALKHQSTKMVEQKKTVKDEYYTRYKPELIAHDDAVKADPTLTQRKQQAECAPHNYYNPESWSSMMARTQSSSDLAHQLET